MLIMQFIKIIQTLLLFSDATLRDPNSSYQEMKAEVTEVPASSLLPEGGHNITGKNTVRLIA